MFPRLAIHTGNSVVTTTRHPEWEGTIVLQHNETTATVLKHGPNMTSAAKRRHPHLSTFQSNCRLAYWAPFQSDNFLGSVVNDGQIPETTGELIGVEAPVAHEG